MNWVVANFVLSAYIALVATVIFLVVVFGA